MLRLRGPLRLGARAMPGGAPAAGRAGARPPLRLHPPQRHRGGDDHTPPDGAAVSSACRFNEPAKAPILSVTGVVKTFAGQGAAGEVQALKGVSLHVMPGESVGLVGESGSGKTTLGRSLVGLETPTAGSVEIAGTGRLSLRRHECRGQVRHTAPDPDGVPGSLFDAQPPPHHPALPA